MKIQKVQSPKTFNIKQRFLKSNQLTDLQIILSMMNRETKTVANEYTFSSDIVSGVNVKNKGSLYDMRFLVGKTNDAQDKSRLEMGKTHLILNNKNGAINGYKKPWYKTWGSVMEDVSAFLKQAVENFDNKDIVERRTIGIQGFTQKGVQIIENAKRRMKND